MFIYFCQQGLVLSKEWYYPNPSFTKPSLPLYGRQR